MQEDNPPSSCAEHESGRWARERHNHSSEKCESQSLCYPLVLYLLTFPHPLLFLERKLKLNEKSITILHIMLVWGCKWWEEKYGCGIIQNNLPNKRSTIVSHPGG